MAPTEPGSTVNVALVSVRVHDDADAGSVVLRLVAATPDGSGLDALWPVGAPGRYKVTASYAVPPVDGVVTPCAGATAAQTVTFTVGDDPDAGIAVDGVDFRVEVENCLKGFAAPGGDPAGVPLGRRSSDRTIGSVQLRLFAAEDHNGTVALNGQPVVATVSQPRLVTRYQFTGTAGMAVALEATDATLSDQCSPLELRDLAGRLLTSGCIINGVGSIDKAVLPVTDIYTIVVDPSGTATGTVTLSLRG